MQRRHSHICGQLWLGRSSWQLLGVHSSWQDLQQDTVNIGAATAAADEEEDKETADELLGLQESCEAV